MYGNKDTIQSLDDDPEDPPLHSEMNAPDDLTRSGKYSSQTSESESFSDKRDEAQEIRNRSRDADRKIQLWRTLLIFLIFAIGSTVSALTFYFLRKEENKAMRMAYDQFSEALADAAIRQQRDIREAFQTFSIFVSDYAADTNKTWPFVDLPKFEAYGMHTLKISGTEACTLFPKVTRENKEAWFNYTEKNYERQIKEAHIIENGNLDDLNAVGYNSFFSVGTREGFIPDIERDYYHPMWQNSPPMFTYGALNWNAGSVPDYASVIEAVDSLKHEQLISKVRPYVTAGLSMSFEEHAQMHSKIEGSSTDFPHSFVFTPVHLDYQDTDSPVVAVITSPMAWDFSLQNLLPEGVVGIYVVLRNTCNQTFTYEINGPDAFYLGEGDLHESESYNDMVRFVDLALHTHPDFESTPGHCRYSMALYPDIHFLELYLTPVPILFAVSILGAFGFMVAVFFMYNWFVNKRNDKLVADAARSNAVITSLFPGNIRDKLIGEESYDDKNNPRTFHDLLDPVRDPLTDLTRPPLADYFATATVMFADICGFTAWSSVREPSQVFSLLEIVYGEFDRLTRRSKVFKVETVGDCYVAATGIPTYHKDHAVQMVKYAHKISRAMTQVTQRLETTLGPDTADLMLRIGIHSGPVTAGVIRGEKARFQLFGDTVNTCARIESTGIAGRIHVSQDTAEHLRQCHKGHWLVKRKEGNVVAKGKGDIQTYWIGKAVEGSTRHSSSNDETMSESADSEQSFGEAVPFGEELSGLNGREDRLVDWNVTVFTEILQHIVSRRNAAAALNRASIAMTDEQLRMLQEIQKHGFKPLDDVKETIFLPKYNRAVEDLQQDPKSVEIPNRVVSELRDYISTIAGLYRSNPFHNFEHASHVTMSVIKLLSRIKAPTEIGMKEISERDNEEDMKAHLHDHTYGITSDPLTQFACAFAALIHDVDHEGVPNAQLVKEGAAVANLYDNRSVAEQNSFVIAWTLFMSNRFANLRDCICATPSELLRFRELAVNAVMATDIVDKDLKSLRNNRWDKAFKNSYSDSDSDLDENRESVNRKATIVIEHLIQASDVSHTMQHWHVYRRWNENFFRETSAAYLAGRSDSNPALTWYKGEIGFFDFYIIPLAKKLESCGVFGKSSDEYLNYAQSNRDEWERRGEEIVAEMVANIEKGFSSPRSA